MSIINDRREVQKMTIEEFKVFVCNLALAHHHLQLTEYGHKYIIFSEFEEDKENKYGKYYYATIVIPVPLFHREPEYYITRHHYQYAEISDVASINHRYECIFKEELGAIIELNRKVVKYKCVSTAVRS